MIEAVVRKGSQLSPAGEIFREAGKHAEARRAEIEQALRVELARYQVGGKIMMGSNPWTITARRSLP